MALDNNNIFLILSIISWVFLIINEFISFFFLSKYHAIWTFWKIDISENHPWPIQMHGSFEFIVFIILFIITIIAFSYYIYKSIFNKDSIIISGMTGQITKFHFIPLICASALFIIGDCRENRPDSSVKKMNIFGLIFVIIGLISLIIIYTKTNLPCHYLPGSIKKGLYSCLIILEWYYFCYDICNIRINNGHYDNMSGYSGFFNVILGIGGLAFAIFFKDIVVDVMLFLIYLGFSIFYFGLKKHLRYNKGFEGAIDIIMMILIILEIGFIIIKYKTECFQ